MLNLSAEEAINRVNESVTVEMLVQRTKCCSGSRQVFLDSEASYRDPKNLGVVVTESARAKFSEAGSVVKSKNVIDSCEYRRTAASVWLE